jgi:hypothetical protein
MNIKDVIQSQYLAALAMLKQAITKCPPDVWDAPQDKDKFWFKAYHTLYYARLYLKTTGRGLVRWKKRSFSQNGVSLSKEEILAYLAFVQQEVADNIPVMDLDAKSGYNWLPSNKLELQLDNIRHIQQHTGELYERLSNHKNIKLGWVSQRSREKK